MLELHKKLFENKMLEVIKQEKYGNESNVLAGECHTLREYTIYM